MKSARELFDYASSNVASVTNTISSFFYPAPRFNPDLSLHANFLAMCSSFRVFPSLYSVSPQFQELVNELKKWGLHCDTNRFVSLSREEIKNDKQLLKAITHDIAVIEMAKMAIHKWCLQCEREGVDTTDKVGQQALLIQCYRNEILRTQEHLHHLYQIVDELQWQPKDQRDCYFSVHLWLTEQGLDILRASLSGTCLKSDFSRLENEVEELAYMCSQVKQCAPSLHKKNG